MDKFLIAPFESGLQKSATPWLEMKDAFITLNNAYIFRGKITKRFGSKYTGTNEKGLKSRLRINLGVTDATGNITVNPVPGTIFKIGQNFLIDDNLFTIITVAPGAQNLNMTSAIGVATFDITTKILTINGAIANKICWFYPNEPVMGLTMYAASAQNQHDTIAFDTQFAYVFTGGHWSRLGTAAWTGDNYDYFWAYNADGITPQITNLYVTNFNKVTPDPIKYYNGGTWTDLDPKFLIAGSIVKTCKIVLPFKDRLLLLNTYEYDGTTYTSYVNRCRYSWNGSPLAAEAWYEPNQAGAGGAGYIDAPTEEQIVSAEFIQDSLIVYFENSTWSLDYTGNEILPFVWRKINTELGSQATFSSIPFDKNILNIGLTGIQACNGNAVERIDHQIPDDIFNIQNDSAQIKRIHGIRDFLSEVAYWSLPKVIADDTYSYPDKVLVYNYENNTFAYNDDCILTYGYFEQQEGITWEMLTQTWQDSDSSWVEGTTLSNTKQVIGGNQHGYVFVIDNKLNSNEHLLNISNITGVDHDEIYVESHNLSNEDAVQIRFYDDTVFNGFVTKLDDNTIKISNSHGYYSNAAYTGGATISRVSKVDIKTTLLNPYIHQGASVSISAINVCVQSTSAGKIAINYEVSSATGLQFYQDAVDTGSGLGSNILSTAPYELIPLEVSQDRFWHKLYIQAEGEYVSLRFYFNDEQLLDDNVTKSNITIEGLILETESRGNV